MQTSEYASTLSSASEGDLVLQIRGKSGSLEKLDPDPLIRTFAKSDPCKNRCKNVIEIQNIVEGRFEPVC